MALIQMFNVYSVPSHPYYLDAIDGKSFGNFFIKTIPLFGISYNRSHWWNHYHKCAIIVCENIALESKRAAKPKRERNWEMKRKSRERDGEMEREREWEMCKEHVVCQYRTFSIYSHDIRVHTETLKMHVYLSIHRNDDVHVSFPTSVRQISISRINLFVCAKCFSWIFHIWTWTRQNELVFFNYLVLKLLFVWHLANKWN